MTTQTCQKTITRIDANPILQSRSNANRTLNVAAYCRVSTDSEDQLSSYEAQVAYYTDYISKNPKWRFAGIYADEGITGTMVKNRTRFNQMIKDSEKGKIDLILTKSVSRFARNTVDSLSYVRRLKAKGIGVFFEEQNCNSLEEDSEMYIGIYSVIAQTESENISANVRWGIQKRMKDGSYSVRCNLLGYQKGEDGEPEIIPDEAAIVRDIYRLFLDGLSLGQIKEHLEANAIKTKQGKCSWSRQIIQNLLSNEKYVGDVIHQKTFRTDCISKKVKVNRGEQAKYLITNNHPAIIDRDTFKSAQLELARRASKRKTSDIATTELGKFSGKYSLSEILLCGECGSPYRRRTINYHGEKRVYWRCLNRIENGKKYCSKSIGVEETKLHSAICNCLAQAIPNSDEIISLISSNLSFAITRDSKILDAYSIEQKIKEIQTQIDETSLLRIRSGANDDKYEEEIVAMYMEIKNLREQFDVAKAQMQTDTVANEEVTRIVEMLKNEGTSFNEYDDVIVHRLIECIRVYSSGKITIVLKGGYEISTTLE